MQLGHFNARLKEAITGRTFWDGINVFLAPLLEGKSDAELQAVARSLLFQLSS